MRALLILLALLASSSAWATAVQNPATIYVKSTGYAQNSGTSDVDVPAAGFYCRTACTTPPAISASWTSGAGGAFTASGSFSTASTTITLTAANCTNVNNGAGVYDTTLLSAGLIGVVASSAVSGTCVVTLTGPSLHQSSAGGTGASDAIYISAPITLVASSTAVDIHTLAGCTLQSGSNYVCDGSQRIRLATATNNAKDFMIAGFSSCSGSGTCIVALGSSATGGAGSANPGCSTCSGATSFWAIGGRILWPDGGEDYSLLPGDTEIVESNMASCGGATCITPHASGDAVMGPISINTDGNGPYTISNSGNFNVVSSGNINGIHFGPGFVFTNTSSTDTQALIGGSGAGTQVVGDTFTATSGATGQCINLGLGAQVIDNNLTLCGGDGIVVASGIVAGNYLSGPIGGNGVTVITVSPNVAIVDNLMAGTITKAGISLSGASVTFAGAALVKGNTIASAGQGGLVVASDYTAVIGLNNIFYEDNGGSGSYYNISYPATVSGIPVGVWSIAGYHGCNIFYAPSGGNLNNVSSNATESTADPVFVTPGSNWSLQTSSPGADTGCWQSPGGYNTSRNYLDMGAIHLNDTGGSSSPGAIMGGPF